MMVEYARLSLRTIEASSMARSEVAEAEFNAKVSEAAQCARRSRIYSTTIYSYSTVRDVVLENAF